MKNEQFEHALSEQLSRLERDVQPHKDLWSGIELALVSESQPQTVSKKWPTFYALAASVAFVVMLGWMAKDVGPLTSDGDALVAHLSAQHLQQKQALLVYFKDQPALTENWQQQVSELDEAEQAIKIALKKDPNNMALLKLLQNVYQQQISLIERVHSPKWSQI